MSSDSDSESESFSSSQSKKLKSDINDCLNAKPTPLLDFSALRSGLLGCSSSPDPPARNLRPSRGDRKVIEDSFKEMSNDLMTLHKKLGGIFDCVTGILDRMENLEYRVIALEKSLKAPESPPQSYAET